MRKRINGKTYDTETAKLIGSKSEGEFGQAEGYEEKLFVTRTKFHFMYGNGGPASKYPKEVINEVSEKEAAAWKKANKIK